MSKRFCDNTIDDIKIFKYNEISTSVAGLPPKGTWERLTKNAWTLADGNLTGSNSVFNNYFT